MRILFDHRIPRFHPQNRRSLGFAPLGFPVEIGGVGELHVPFLARKGTHATVSSAAGEVIGSG